jgi:hypothetical protein
MPTSYCSSIRWFSQSRGDTLSTKVNESIERNDTKIKSCSICQDVIDEQIRAGMLDYLSKSIENLMRISRSVQTTASIH